MKDVLDVLLLIINFLIKKMQGYAPYVFYTVHVMSPGDRFAISLEVSPLPLPSDMTRDDWFVVNGHFFFFFFLSLPPNTFVFSTL